MMPDNETWPLYLLTELGIMASCCDVSKWDAPHQRARRSLCPWQLLLQPVVLLSKTSRMHLEPPWDLKEEKRFYTVRNFMNRKSDAMAK